MSRLKVRFVLSGGDVSAWAPFPSDLHYHSEKTHDGVLEHIFTPPIGQGRDAVRIRGTRHIDASGTITSSSFSQQRCLTWLEYASRSNWAGCVYGDDPTGLSRFRSARDKSMPKQLYRRWMPDVWRFIYAQDQPKLDELLRGHANWVAYRDNQAQSRGDKLRHMEERYGKVEHGDIFLLDHPVPFTDGTKRSAFLALRKPGKGQPLKSYLLPTSLSGDHPIYPVTANFGRVTRTRMFKLCEASLDDFLPDASAHEKIELIGLQKQIHANLDRIQVF